MSHDPRSNLHLGIKNGKPLPLHLADGTYKFRVNVKYQNGVRVNKVRPQIFSSIKPKLTLLGL